MEVLLDIDAAWRLFCETALRLPEVRLAGQMEGRPDPALQDEILLHHAPTERPAWMVDVDARLADFILRFPGLFEARLATVLADSATACGGDTLTRDAVRAVFEVSAGVWRHFEQASGALDPVATLRLLARSCAPPEDHATARSLEAVMVDCARRAGPEVIRCLDVPPVKRDVLLHHATGARLPPLLPEDVHLMSPAEIADTLATYLGIPIEALEGRMRRSQEPLLSYLAPGDRLVEIIWRDARTLEQLGVSRSAIADRLERLLDDEEPEDAPHLRIEYTGGLCCFVDPFTSGRIGQSPGIFEVHHRATGESLRSHVLVKDLIRSACFFEGHVPCRLEPEIAVRVLGLV